MKHKRKALILSVCLAAVLAAGCVLPAFAASAPAGQSVNIYAAGQYANWDGVTNVAQFRGADGSLWYAVDSEAAVTVYKTKNGAPVSGSVSLRKPHPLFGTVVCGSDGSFYLVTGEANAADNTDAETVFISKFDKNGSHVKTVGDNGSSSLAYYYDDSFYTKDPFHAGNCDAAISGTTLTVFYARGMYSGHQSCSVFSVNTDDLSKVDVGSIYESHSFAQRVVPTKEGFVYVSEGDCYDRAFSAYSVKLSGGRATYRKSAHLFDFWVEDGALDSYNMFVVNNNFAHMGGLAALPNGNVAFAASSVPSLNSDAENENEQVFIQIFDPYASLDTPSAFITEGERTGLAGNNGRTPVTNYGVKWLTSYGKDETVRNVQIAATDQGEIFVLYELSRGYEYAGVWYMILDAHGNVVRSAAPFSAKARLNPCETPVYADGAVCWVGNRYEDPDRQIFVYRLTGTEEDCAVTNKHTWDNGTVTAAPTCASAGEKTFTCTVCEAVKTEVIAKKPHQLSKTAAKAATCTAAGNVEYYTCSVCKKTFSDAKGAKELQNVTIPAAGHKLTKTAAKTATCTAAGNVEYYTCSVCKKTFSDAGGGKEIKDVIVKASGHSFGAWQVKKEATVTEEGAETRKCAKCGAEETRPIAKLQVTYRPGDVDANGEIEVTDARYALRAAVELETYAPGSAQFLAADTDKNGEIEVSDARNILRAAVGLDQPENWGK